MKGFYLGINGDQIEKATIESMELSLLAKGDGTEVILQHIEAGKTFYVFPSERNETLEFFYILDGKCEYENKNHSTSLKKGDYFYVQELNDIVYFKAVTNIKMLWISSQPTFHFISESINELVKVVKQVEKKDSYTYQHSIRVQEYSLKIAKELKLSTEELENLYFASLFHDIGKIDIDEKILNNPGRLTNEEFTEMKRHPLAGYEMVKSTYYEGIGDIILQHHERLNGSGYPSGLKNDEILFEAKIIGVADTYDAMTSDRPYRKGLSPEKSIAEIKELSGELYEEVIVLALERSLIESGVL